MARLTRRLARRLCRLAAAPPVLWLLFFLVVTPAGIALRLLRRDILRLRPDRQAASYWRLRPAGPPERRE